MKPSDGFGIIIRTIGLLSVIVAVGYGITFLYLLLSSEPTHQEYGAASYAVFTTAFAIFGLYCLRGAPRIVRFAYPDNSTKHSDFQQDR